MLIGEYNCALDVKGRANFPAKLRENLGSRFIIAKGLGDNCLAVYSLEEWAEVGEKIKSLPLSKARNLQRFFFASACEVEPDKQGRVVIPANLREFGGLDKDIMIIGVESHCEIWSKENWDDLCNSMNSQSIGEVLDELGI